MILVPALVGRAIVRVQLPLAAHDESEPEPDLAIVPLGDYRGDAGSLLCPGLGRLPGHRALRGDAWLPEPCASCDQRGIDHGGRRCQAFALTGDMHATDPACDLAPAHALVRAAREEAERAAPRAYVYRGR